MLASTAGLRGSLSGVPPFPLSQPEGRLTPISAGLSPTYCLRFPRCVWVRVVVFFCGGGGVSKTDQLSFLPTFPEKQRDPSCPEVSLVLPPITWNSIIFCIFPFLHAEVFAYYAGNLAPLSFLEVMVLFLEVFQPLHSPI